MGHAEGWGVTGTGLKYADISATRAVGAQGHCSKAGHEKILGLKYTKDVSVREIWA
jgi:hypothetical protein